MTHRAIKKKPAHCPKKNLNLHIKTVPITVAARWQRNMYDFYERDKVYTSKQKSDIASAPAVLYVFMRRFRILLGQCTSCDTHTEYCTYVFMRRFRLLLGQCTSCDTRTDYCMFLCGDSDYCWDSVPAVIPLQITVRLYAEIQIIVGTV